MLIQPVLAEGPLARSVAAEAERLAAQWDRQASEDWRTAARLERDSPIVVTTTRGTIAGRFDSIDERAVVVVHDVTSERLNRDEITLITRTVRRGSALGTALGTVGGMYLGSLLAMSMAFNVRCQPGCGGVEAAMAAVAIGTPIASGYGTWRATSRVVEQVVYRRPSLRP